MTVFEEIQQGVYYFKSGWQMIRQKGLKRFVVIPVALNVVLLLGVMSLFLYQVNQQLHKLTTWLPSWLSWLDNIIFYLVLLLLLVVYYFIFNAISSFIAAPFLGVLAEKVEQSLCSNALSDNDDLMGAIKDTPRVFKREWTKLVYTIPRFLLLMLLGFVPVLGQLLAPILIFVWTCFSQTVQYCDYAFDNNKVSFVSMRKAISQNRYMSFSFGVLVMICTFIPFVNFVILPVATCGATKMWVDCYRNKFVNN